MTLSWMGRPSDDESWLPIICYHDVVPRPTLSGAMPYSIELDRFAKQMRLLHLLGYRTVSVRQAAACVRERRPAPRRSIVLTFDDGYRSTRTQVLPILDALGFTATAYLVVDYLNSRRDAADYLTDADARALLDAGWEIGSHTLSHPDLTRIAPDRLAGEVATSRQALAERFDRPIDTFCYPHHLFSRDVYNAVVEAGYEAACGGYNVAHRLYDLSRISGPLYNAGALALRCTRGFWRLRTNELLRQLKHESWRRTFDI